MNMAVKLPMAGSRLEFRKKLIKPAADNERLKRGLVMIIRRLAKASAFHAKLKMENENLETGTVRTGVEAKSWGQGGVISADKAS
jgi:hypothetical protein